MANFLKRFFLFFFPILACLFLVSLLLPVAAFAHTMRPFSTESSDANFYAILLQALTPTPVPTVAATATATVAPTAVPTATATVVPTAVPTATAAPTPVPTATATAVPSPTPTTVPTPSPTPTPTTGNNTNANGAHTVLNALIFTMGGVGVLLVIVGVILYFVYSRSI